MNRRNAIQALTIAPLLAGSAFASKVGETVVLPPIKLIDGTVLAPAHWRGKVLIAERFATWCPFCKVQNPKLEKLYRAHREKGLEVSLLSVDKNPAEVPKEALICPLRTHPPIPPG